MIDVKQESRLALWKAARVQLAVAIVGAVFSMTVAAQEAGQKTFAAPSDASKALYDAALARDTNALLSVLGASAKPLLSSGDEVADRKKVDDFLGRYGQMNRWHREGNGDRTLLVGVENWPFPIPLKQSSGGQWYFDTKAGTEEILYRRIGDNEFGAIRVCGILAEAQLEYFQGLHDGDTVHQYAQKILSDSGKQNGLYWKAANGEPESPIGPLVASASAEGYKEQGAPFHGYIFRILNSQGAKARGGAKSYIVGGKMTRGFALIAYPAEYRNSGVMTFLVDSKGVIYEKDLGPQTTATASAMSSFNLDATWRTVSTFVEDEAEEVGVQ
jgi:hypothetical protein